MGIEPTSKAWEALVLPMNYARETSISDIYFERATKNESIRIIAHQKIILVNSKHFLDCG